MLDVEGIRKSFPILDTMVYGHPLVYLDNAATTQMPQQVLARVEEHYHVHNANIHRGIHALSERSTRAYEEARGTVRSFINAADDAEIIFTAGTTASVNLVASMVGDAKVRPGDEIIVSQLEHHSNFVPWQMLCQKRQAVLRVIPAVDGELDLAAYKAMLCDRTKLVAITQVANTTGTVTPLKEMIDEARRVDALVLVDGAQAMRHGTIDVQELGCDFYCFSGHKVMASTGIGVLYISKKRHATLSPAWYGGGMVDTVTACEVTFEDAPHRYEAGTPNYVGAIALGTALDFLQEIGLEHIAAYEAELLSHAESSLNEVPGVAVLGRPARRAGAISFTVEGVHPYDLSSILDKKGIAVRSGQLCAQPALQSFGLASIARVSPAFYNTAEEIDAFIKGLEETILFLRKWST